MLPKTTDITEHDGMVLRDDIAAAYQRLVEQASSDEHMLGALPEDASQPLLDWQLARLEVAARSSTSDAELHQRADAIRATAHSIADAAAADGDDGVAMRARLHAFDADEDRPIEGASAPPNANAPTAAVTSPPLTTPADQPSVTGEPESLRDTESADLVEPARPQPTRRRWVIAGIAAAGLALVLAVIAVVSCRGRSEQPDAVDAPPAGDGWYEALFTTPQRTGTPAAGSSGRLDERLVREIDA